MSELHVGIQSCCTFDCLFPYFFSSFSHTNEVEEDDLATALLQLNDAILS